MRGWRSWRPRRAADRAVQGLGPWAVTAVGAIALAALWWQQNHWKPPVATTRTLALLVLATATGFAGLFGYLSYRVLSSGLVKCFVGTRRGHARTCGTRFVDDEGLVRHASENLIAAWRDPFGYWAFTGLLLVVSFLAMAWFFHSVRRMGQWRNLT